MRAPEIPDDVTARDLDAKARNELKTLTKDNADGVARHLAMAARLVDDDPQLAHEHAQAASRRAGRIPVVRETVAITAYRLGDYVLALRELRTYRRLSGRDDQIALIVDSERGLGRPERALEEGRAVDRATLSPAVRAELAIAMSGAWLDLAEPARALRELDIPELDPDRAFEWSPALFAARATVLEDLGRDAEAADWRRRAEVAEEALEENDPVDDVILVDDLAPDEPTVADLSTVRDDGARAGDDGSVDGADVTAADEAGAAGAIEPADVPETRDDESADVMGSSSGESHAEADDGESADVADGPARDETGAGAEDGDSVGAPSAAAVDETIRVPVDPDAVGDGGAADERSSDDARA